MSRARWHILREQAALTLTRAVPARFDIGAETVLPMADPLRLAHQIRQDMWRALQKLRGFSPVVRLEARDGGLLVRAGGRVAAPVPPAAVARIAEVLESPANRQRWLRHAGRRAATFDKPGGNAP
ncbi:hypothetical protein [Aquicoccus sp. SU-CL01552]|uniref:hypothetical protein n=1 Tax=Aquicoccus sp. SU-CL01552 TaxID=3127656 RepID=UPI00310B12A3